jgi:hypothetical protein
VLIAPLSLRLTQTRPDASSPLVAGSAIYSAFANVVLNMNLDDDIAAELVDHIAYAQDGDGRDLLVEDEEHGVCLNFPAISSAPTELTSELVRHWFLALFAHDRSFVDETAASEGWLVTTVASAEIDDGCVICRALR